MGSLFSMGVDGCWSGGAGSRRNGLKPFREENFSAVGKLGFILTSEKMKRGKGMMMMMRRRRRRRRMMMMMVVMMMMDPDMMMMRRRRMRMMRK